MNIIENPNLPTKNVKVALCDSRVGEEIISELNNMGCNIIKVPENKSLQQPVNAHPDMNFVYVNKNELYVSEEFYNSDNYNELTEHCEIFNNRVKVVKLSSKYPGDVLLNVAVIGGYIVCNKEFAEKEILKSANKVIHVKQGYAKCSIAPVAKDAFITDDVGIYNATKNTFDVCLVNRGEIKLNGYNYGFIGGSCGKLSKDVIAFFGDLNKFTDSEKIISFCRNHNVYCTSLSNKALYDYGSLIPLFE